MSQARSSAFSPTLDGAVAFPVGALLRPTVSRAGNAALMCPKKDPPNWHTRLELTPQQADLLDFPRVVYSQVRILW